MDRVPSTPEQPEVEAERKKRLLKRLRGFVGQELNLDEQRGEDGGGTEEFWSRDTSEVTDDARESKPAGIESRTQQLGRSVLRQASEVYGFAESLGEHINELPEESRAAVAPEADRLKRATGKLQEATEELNEELEDLDERLGESGDEFVEKPASQESAPPPAEASFESPRVESKPGTGGMARLVIATLIAGGIGALVGEGRKGERKQVKEAAKANKSIEEQKAKIAAQEAELQQLRAAQPESAQPQKEFIDKTSDLTERQTEITHVTTEQVRAVAEQAAESERTFKIPGRQGEAVRPKPEVLGGEGDRAERLHEQPGEIRDNRDSRSGGDERSYWQTSESTSQTGTNTGPQQPGQQPYAQPVTRKLVSNAWVFGALLAAAVLVAAWLFIF